MGLFDQLHDGDHCMQVKCLGKSMRSIRPGDSARLYAFPNDDGGSQPLRLFGVETDQSSWQVQLVRGVAVFIDRTFVGWRETPVDGVLLVDNHGRNETEASRWNVNYVDRGWEATPDGCEVCDEIVRSRTSGY